MATAMLASGATVESPSLGDTTALSEAIVDAQVAEDVLDDAAPEKKEKAVTGPSGDAGAIVQEYFADAPIMAKIAWCESTWRQFDSKGNPLRGIVNASDVGIMQINEYYHSATATKLGLDLHTLEGNMAYGRYLYETQGTAPWIHSKPCWSKYL
jgi:hypothetical protein